MQFSVNSNLLSSTLSQSKLSYKSLILLSFLFFSLFLFYLFIFYLKFDMLSFWHHTTSLDSLLIITFDSKLYKGQELANASAIRRYSAKKKESVIRRC